MAIRKIYTGDAPCLYKTAKPVKEFNKHLFDILDDMADTMYNAEGCGLAAPQVGILRRVVVIDCSEDGTQLIEAINPEVVYTEGEAGDMEGCLSFPNEQGYVMRPTVAVMRAYDRGGNQFEVRGEGLLARAIMHELDHLDGRIYKSLVIPAPPTQNTEDAE